MEFLILLKYTISSKNLRQPVRLMKPISVTTNFYRIIFSLLCCPVLCSEIEQKVCCCMPICLTNLKNPPTDLDQG